jgi:hypothetical protein
MQDALLRYQDYVSQLMKLGTNAYAAKEALSSKVCGTLWYVFKQQ